MRLVSFCVGCTVASRRHECESQHVPYSWLFPDIRLRHGCGHCEQHHSTNKRSDLNERAAFHGRKPGQKMFSVELCHHFQKFLKTGHIAGQCEDVMLIWGGCGSVWVNFSSWGGSKPTWASYFWFSHPAWREQTDTDRDCTKWATMCQAARSKRRPNRVSFRHPFFYGALELDRFLFLLRFEIQVLDSKLWLTAITESSLPTEMPTCLLLGRRATLCDASVLQTSLFWKNRWYTAYPNENTWSQPSTTAIEHEQRALVCCAKKRSLCYLPPHASFWFWVCVQSWALGASGGLLLLHQESPTEGLLVHLEGYFIHMECTCSFVGLLGQATFTSGELLFYQIWYIFDLLVKMPT